MTPLDKIPTPRTNWARNDNSMSGDKVFDEMEKLERELNEAVAASTKYQTGYLRVIEDRNAWKQCAEVCIAVMEDTKETISAFHGYHFDHTEQRRMCVELLAKLSAYITNFNKLKGEKE
jgi:hypothetical protein